MEKFDEGSPKVKCNNCGKYLTETVYEGAYAVCQHCGAVLDVTVNFQREKSENTKNKTVNILGTKYTILVKKYDEDKTFAEKSFDGYCDPWAKQIVICDFSTYPGWENEPEDTVRIAQSEALRHEIVHAFLDESGLSFSSCVFERGWAKNEEMIDWFALQGPKIYKAWKDSGAW